MNQILAMREKRAGLWEAAKKFRDSKHPCLQAQCRKASG